MKKLIALIVIAGCAYTHRRVIRALITHEPMPKAPAWHFWVSPQQRRS
ncbi:MAG: hypothetical protein IKS32_11650 [Solobacterium sp.]|nr:hypothetical protein [Solobacterium sp.]